MRLKIPKLRYDRILWVCFLFVVGLVFLSSVSKKKRSSIDDVVIEIQPLSSGAKLIEPKNVEAVLREGFGKNLDNELITSLDFERVEEVMERDPFVLEAQAFLDINNRLHVNIKQREPILRIMDDAGGNYYLDPVGHQVPISPNYTARVMVATGNIQPYVADFLNKETHSLTKLMHLRWVLDEDDRFATFFQQIHVNKKGEFVLVPLIGKQQILLGNLANLEDKLDRIELFYKEAMPQEGWNKFRTLDLRFNDQIVGVR